MKFIAKNKEQDISAVSLGGREYRAEDGIIEVPDDHHAARDAAKLIGLAYAPAEEVTPKKLAK